MRRQALTFPPVCPLPQIRLGQSKFAKDFIDSRREGLQSYLQAVVSAHDPEVVDTLNDFLEYSENFLLGTTRTLEGITELQHVTKLLQQAMATTVAHRRESAAVVGPGAAARHAATPPRHPSAGAGAGAGPAAFASPARTPSSRRRSFQSSDTGDSDDSSDMGMFSPGSAAGSVGGARAVVPTMGVDAGVNVMVRWLVPPHSKRLCARALFCGRCWRALRCPGFTVAV